MKELANFELGLNFLSLQADNYSESEGKLVTDLINSIAEIKAQPRRSLLPVSKLHEILTTLLASRTTAKKFGPRMPRLRCALSLCKITESLIKARHPKIPVELQRPLTPTRSIVFLYHPILSPLKRVFHGPGKEGGAHQAQERESGKRIAEMCRTHVVRNVSFIK